MSREKVSGFCLQKNALEVLLEVKSWRFRTKSTKKEQLPPRTCRHIAAQALLNKHLFCCHESNSHSAKLNIPPSWLVREATITIAGCMIERSVLKLKPSMAVQDKNAKIVFYSICSKNYTDANPQLQHLLGSEVNRSLIWVHYTNAWVAAGKGEDNVFLQSRAAMGETLSDWRKRWTIDGENLLFFHTAYCFAYSQGWISVNAFQAHTSSEIRKKKNLKVTMRVTFP